MLNFSGYTHICGVPLISDSPKWQNLTCLVTYHHAGGVGGAKNLSTLNIYWVRVPQKEIDQFGDPSAGKLICSRKTFGCSIDWTPELRLIASIDSCQFKPGRLQTAQRRPGGRTSSWSRFLLLGRIHPIGFSMDGWAVRRLLRFPCRVNAFIPSAISVIYIAYVASNCKLLRLISLCRL